MEANKENIHNKIKTSTRIPIPVEPRSKKINSKKEGDNKRPPLKTLTQQNLRTKQKPGTLPALHRPSEILNIVSKQKHTSNINVLKDIKEDDSDKVIISDDEEENDINAEKKRSSHESPTAVSPLPLCFTETRHEKLKSPDFWKKSYMKCQDYTIDIFTYLIEVEQKVAIPKLSTRIRACIINSFIRNNTADGNPAIIQTACWYLDAILSKRKVAVDALEVIAAACYWIAHKLHGSDLRSSHLIKGYNNEFTREELVAAEEVVLKSLTFPRRPVVPEDYITYLSWWCDNDHPGEIEVGATFLTMCFMIADTQYCNEYPSVIAAAAVRNTLMLLRKVDLIMRLEACPVFKSAEKKAENLSHTCSLIRRGALAVASPAYEYKAHFEHYSVPPHCIAQRIINAASEPLAPARNTATKN